MSTEHFVYVGVYVLLENEKPREPIIDGVREYWGCEEHGRKGKDAKYCPVCAQPLHDCSVPNKLDDCMENVIGEDMTDHPLYIAINDIGCRAWYCGDEGTAELIVVNNAACSIDLPEVNYEDDRSVIDGDILSPADAIKTIEKEHAKSLGVLKEYFEEVSVLYGGVHTISC